MFTTNPFHLQNPVTVTQESLVGGFNPFEKYASQIGPFPHVVVKNDTYLKPPN